MGTSRDVYVFYHIFLIKVWRDRLKMFLGGIKRSGLYERCKSIELVVIYDDEKELEELRSKVRGLDKVNFHFKRHWRVGKPFSFDLGESEGILKMIRFSRQNPGHYLFCHSKSVTNDWKRKLDITTPFYNKGVANYLLQSNNERFNKVKDIAEHTPNKFYRSFLKQLHYEVIDNWEECINTLDKENYYHWYVNFFWIRSELLNRFSMVDYCRKLFDVKFPHTPKSGYVRKEWKPIAQNGKPRDRHFMALFAYKMDWIYGKKNDVFLSGKPYKDKIGS